MNKNQPVSNGVKKILIFSVAYYPFIGGAEVAVKEITDRNPDFDYYLITNKFDTNWPDEEKIGNINVRRVGKGKKIDKYLYPLRAFRYALRLHKMVKFDFVWSIMAFYAGATSLFFRYKTRVPYLLTLQSGDSDTFLKKRTWWWSFWYKRVYRRAKLTQVISNYLGKRSRQMGNKGEIILIPNGVDLEVFQTKSYEEDQPEADQPLAGKLDLKQHLGLEDEIILISVSRLVSKNGLDDLIKAVNFLLYKSGIDVKLLLLGSGSDEFELRNLVQKLGVTDNVIFLGHLDHTDLPKYLQIADIFIRPSLSEGLGNSFLESMLVGTPIIGTEIGGIPDFLTDEKTGLFCKINNSSSIAQAVEKYIDNQDLYNQIKIAGQKLVSEKYNWDIIAKKMKQVFDKMNQ
ncbi:glycosyltransferase family 4 protein [bacterium]|jgi:glycosyltransferase involved in cell wall biosynthesis|nr:glycosyltransferase family 4 protein [bacterium]